MVLACLACLPSLNLLAVKYWISTPVALWMCTRLATALYFVIFEFIFKYLRSIYHCLHITSTVYLFFVIHFSTSKLSNDNSSIWDYLQHLYTQKCAFFSSSSIEMSLWNTFFYFWKRNTQMFWFNSPFNYHLCREIQFFFPIFNSLLSHI